MNVNNVLLGSFSNLNLNVVSNEQKRREKITYSNGYVYEGTLQDLKRSGWGTFSCKKKEALWVWEGTWENDILLSGAVLNIWNKNTLHGKYKGCFEDYEPHGKGVYTLFKGKLSTEFHGIWEKGELYKATIFYPNGEFYYGDVVRVTLEQESQPHGAGKYVFKSSPIYSFDGAWDRGQPYEGTVAYRNGGYYRGTLKEPSRIDSSVRTITPNDIQLSNGDGYYLFEDDHPVVSFTGIWSDGKPVKGEVIYRDGKVYEGLIIKHLG